MFMSSISLDASPATPAAADPASASNAAAAPGGGDFAGRLALAQAALPPGQNLAAGGLPLQATALGPTLEVVTPAADAPDADALAEFAKAQGLDEEVVAWLFGDPAALAQAQAQALAAMQPASAAAAATPTLTLSDGATSASPLTAVSLLATQAGGNGLPAAPQPGADAALAAALAGAASALPAWLQQQAGPGAAAATPAPDAGTAPDAAAPAAMQLQSFAAALAAAASATTQGQDPAAANAPQAPAGEAAVEVLSVEVDVEPGLEALWDADAAPSPVADAASAGGASAGGAGQDPGAATQGLPDDSPTTTLAQRAQGYQALAERLGEAVAQRVLSQFEKGNWQVKLMLRPQKLGEVEIDLKMKAGQIDAAFQASNPVTRDLLNDGLPRLREVLSQAGMDIADLNVGTGKGQQAGGNPTPRQSPGPATASGAPAGAQAPDAASAAAPTARRAPSSAWDVLV